MAKKSEGLQIKKAAFLEENGTFKYYHFSRFVFLRRYDPDQVQRVYSQNFPTAREKQPLTRKFRKNIGKYILKKHHVQEIILMATRIRFLG